MAKIYAPNKSYTGTSASVAFLNGVGETDSPFLLNWFEEHGYKVEGLEEPKNEEPKNEEPKNEEPSEEKSLEDMKKDELKLVAEGLGIEFNTKTTNEQLVELIQAKQAEKSEDDEVEV